ncbi:hypothetical protein A8M77_23155 [Variovorax sp. JS1663]|nr:hypothetical protein A8M77_23155 [Variovorax sp. JS1663]
MTSRSIQASLTRWFAVQSLVGLSVACASVYGVTRWSFELKHAEEFDRHIELVRHVVRETREPLDLGALQHKLNDYFLTHPEAAVELWAGSRRIYSSQRLVDPRNWTSRVVTLDGIALGDQPVEAKLALNVGGDQVLLKRLAWTLVGAAGLGTVLVSFTGALLVRRGLRPLNRLAAQTAAAGPHHPGLRIEASGYASELQPWIVQFNALLQRAEDAYAQLEAFNADVAHELRTPLSNMIAQVEVELGQARSQAVLQEVLSSHLEEARRLSSVVTDMLFLSKADRGAKARRNEAGSLAREVEAVAEFHEAALEEAQLTLKVKGDAEVHMDAGLIRRALSNLVSNAVRYARPKTLVLVEIQRAAGLVEISVVNFGPSISEEAMPRLFERFYRADQSRAGSSSHHGLGLSIVAAIARMHGGSTFASSARGVTRIGFTVAHDSTNT